jgi:structural maintenance of chromosome 1
MIRIQFERSQLDATRERLQSLQNRTERGRSNVNQLIERKRIIEDELSSLERDVNDKRQALAEAKKAHEEIVNQVDALRDAARRTQRSLDRALKEISGWNDEIDKFASDRHAIYRKCRLEEIDLPLKRGRLDKVPLEEVCAIFSEERG